MSVQIPLGKHGQQGFAIVDEADAERVREWAWATNGGRGYIVNVRELPSGKLKLTYLHRFILDAPLGMTVDHIDGDKRNNTRANLRICTQAENAQNRQGPARNRKQRLPLGVYQAKSRYRVYAKDQYIGCFRTVEEADAAAQAARARLMPFSKEGTAARMAVAQ